jgi:hypothetical protein
MITSPDTIYCRPSTPRKKDPQLMHTFETATFARDYAASIDMKGQERA